MSSSAGAIFTGNSQFSSAFQQAISRATSYASLPMQQTQSEVTSLQAEVSELNTLNSDFFSLQASISTLAAALGLNSFTSSSSTNAVATASLSGTPAAASYTVEVESIGTHASAMSGDGLSKVGDPAVSSISDASTFTLTVGTVSYKIQTADTSLLGLAEAINNSPADVQATVVNLGTDGKTDYRLSIQDNKLEQVMVQLASLDGSSPASSLLDPMTDGAPTTYRINGSPAAGSNPLSTRTASVVLAPGVTVSLLAEGTTTVKVSQSANAVSSALQSFVSAYNTIQKELVSNRGQGTGALQGQSILASLSDVLHQVTGYSTGTDGISSLTALGVEFDQNGNLSLNASTFAKATQGQMSALSDFLGSVDSGGFLKAASDALTSLTDPSSGLFPSAIGTVKSSIARDNQAISDDQDRINTLLTNLNAKMAAADAAVASLEQQYSYLTQMFQQMQANTIGGVY